MIDWISARFRCDHAEDIQGGWVVSLAADQTVEWQVLKSFPVVGSHFEKMMVRSSPCYPGQVEFSGCPAKFLQGHNIFGSSDLRGLTVAVIERIVRILALKPSEEDRSSWKDGCIKLARVDLTESFDLGNRSRVHTAIKALSESSYLVHRGRASVSKESTVYWGKHSRRWSLKAYSKGDEIEAAKHRLPSELRDSMLPAFADGLLRVEVVMRSMELKSVGLDSLMAWSENTPKTLYSHYLEGLQISENAVLNAETLSGLAPRAQLAYNSWREGHDLRQMLPRKTFYRYRKELLALGVDIAVVQPRRQKTTNVVPLRIVLQAVPVSVPDWAVGTPLYFDPVKRAA